MKKLLNTVYVTTECAALRKDGENLVAEIEGVERARVPLHMLASVVAFGRILVSPALIGACAGVGITNALLDRVGRFQARIEGPISGNVLLRRAQYRASEAPEEIVRSFVIGKVANQRAVLMRALRDDGAEMPPDTRAAIEGATERIAHVLRRASFTDATLDALRGSEGEAANLYFSVFDHLIRSPDPRTALARTLAPPDPVNALLSFLYTLLTHYCRSACESVGLDPAVGFLHRDRPGPPEPGTRPDGGIARAPRRPARTVTTEPPPAARRGFPRPRRRGGSAHGRRAQAGADRLAGAQEGRTPAHLPRRKGALRPRALAPGANAGAVFAR